MSNKYNVENKLHISHNIYGSLSPTSPSTLQIYFNIDYLNVSARQQKSSFHQKVKDIIALTKLSNLLTIAETLYPLKQYLEWINTIYLLPNPNKNTTDHLMVLNVSENKRDAFLELLKTSLGSSRFCDIVRVDFIHHYSQNEELDLKELRLFGFKNDENKDLPSCPVCLDKLETTSNLPWLTLFCGHIFHASCMISWFDNRCPICRHSYLESMERDSSYLESSTHDNEPCLNCLESEDLFQCLICGSESCLIHSTSHAKLRKHRVGLHLPSHTLYDFDSACFLPYNQSSPEFDLTGRFEKNWTLVNSKTKNKVKDKNHKVGKGKGMEEDGSVIGLLRAQLASHDLYAKEIALKLEAEKRRIEAEIQSIQLQMVEATTPSNLIQEIKTKIEVQNRLILKLKNDIEDGMAAKESFVEESKTLLKGIEAVKAEGRKYEEGLPELYTAIETAMKRLG